MFDFYHYKNIIIAVPFATRAEMGYLSLSERAPILHDTLPEKAACTTVLGIACVIFLKVRRTHL